MIGAVAGYLIFRSLDRIKINGPLYQKIIDGKDLVADILPPPEYIVESYLLVLQIQVETDPEALSNLAERGRRLREEFDARHEFWVKTLPEGRIRTLLLDQSWRPAKEFFDIRDRDFVPLMLAGKREDAVRQFAAAMRQKYEEHRAAIDELVPLVNAQNASIEESVAAPLQLAIRLGVLAAGGSILLALAMAYLISLKITSPLARCALLLKELSQNDGDLTKRLAIKSRDEIGELSNSFDLFMDKLHDVMAKVTAPRPK